MIAVYKCRVCKHVFTQAPGPVKQGCPKCHHEYVDWLNFEQCQESPND